MNDRESLDVTSVRKERRLATILLLLICLTLAHFIHAAWFAGISDSSEKQPGPGTPVYHLFEVPLQKQYAPEAYRVAIPAIGRFLVRAFNVKDVAWVAAELDFVFSFFALYLFYRLAVGKLSGVQAIPQKRWIVVLLYFAFIQFPIAWVVPWQRPETLPTALYLAFGLSALGRAKNNSAWTGLLLVATAAQAFVRSDVPFVFGVSLATLALFGGGLLRGFGPRLSLIIKGTCIAGLAGIIQLFLQCIYMPHLTYWPGYNVIHFRENLRFHNLFNCATALLPFLCVGALIVYRKIRIDSLDALIIACSTLYLILWFIVGIVDEVRLFVPFMMALSVVAAKALAAHLTDDEPIAARAY